MIGFALLNEEMGWIDKCPVFSNKETANIKVASKCRSHSVIEVNAIRDCHPLAVSEKCKSCLRFTGCKK